MKNNDNGASGHTPGPWLHDGLTVYALDETGNCNRFSARVEGGWLWRSLARLGNGGDRTTEAELAANARLIAAVPDLVDEGRFLIERLDEFEQELMDDDVASQFFGHVIPSLARFRAIIAKATHPQDESAVPAGEASNV